MSAQRLCIVGLGKLGIPMAACFASKGFEVIGVDRDAARVAALGRGLSPIVEPRVQELLTAHGGRVTATTDTAAAVRQSDAVFIIVPTPSQDDGTFTPRFVVEACRDVARGLTQRPRPQLVVVTSTVMPGDTIAHALPTLERCSGLRAGEHFHLCYSPEFIALGSVVRDFLNPDMLLIGEHTPAAGQALVDIYRRTTDNSPAVARMSIVNAELTKIAVNSFVTTKITFANMLANLCEGLPGGDVDVVTAALGLDTRIGRKYLKGAVAFGGPCFPRDAVALAALGRRLGDRATLAESTDAANRAQTQRLADVAAGLVPPRGAAAVLGLAYKPDTDVCEQSPGLHLCQALVERGVAVTAFDPLAMGSAARVLGDAVTMARSAEEAIAAADVVAVTTPWPQFARLPADVFARPTHPRTVIDCWRMLDRAALAAVANVVAVGVGDSTAAAAQRAVA